MTKYILTTPEETERFGIALGESLKPGDSLALIGDMGTGKTTLTKAIAKGLGVKEEVTSPTFAIVKEYRSGRIPLFHFDAYRLNGISDALERGIEEYFYMDGISVVEWADIIKELLPENTKYIYLRCGEDSDERILECTF